MPVAVILGVLASATTAAVNLITISQCIKKRKLREAEEKRRQEELAAIKIQTAFRRHKVYKIKVMGMTFEMQSSSK